MFSLKTDAAVGGKLSKRIREPCRDLTSVRVGFGGSPKFHIQFSDLFAIQHDIDLVIDAGDGEAVPFPWLFDHTLAGARCPKAAPQCQVSGASAHCG